MFIFVEVSVDYDSRIPVENRMILKFKDIDGYKYRFIKDEENSQDGWNH